MQNRFLVTKGISILEIIIVIALIIIAATILFMRLDPAGVAADARNRKREADVNALLNLVYRNISDNGGTFICAAGALPTSTVNMSDNAPAAGDYDVAGCLVPKYISILPYDPKTTGAHYSSTTDYDLRYSISVSTTTGRVIVSAPDAERGKNITIAR